MYRIEYLPAARQDMIEIVQYVSQELQNPIAANQLALKLIEAGDGIPRFPYANSSYTPIRLLKHEYRKLLVRNYFIFYWVDEAEQLVTVARVVYAKRDYERLLE